MSYPVEKELLAEFIKGFYGYGNLKGPYWFIGKEEGGGSTLDENFRRILTWKAMGQATTVDMIDYHIQLGFGEELLNRVQPTWTKLIQILLEIEGEDSRSIDTRRYYQRHHLGRLLGNNCCLELMPLASRSTGLWLWQEIMQAYFGYRNRRDYFAPISRERQIHLQELIETHSPKLVVFYSSQSDYVQHWQEISGLTQWVWEDLASGFRFGWARKDNTLFVITPHPTAHGLTIHDFPTIGKEVKKLLT